MILNGGSGRDQAAGWASASTADATGGLTPGAEMKPWVMSTREKATAWFGSKVGDSRAGKVLTGAFDAWLVAPEMLTRVPDIVTAIPSGIGRLADATVSTAVDLWNDPLGTATGAIGSGVDGLRAGFNRTVNGDGLAMGSALFAMGTVSVPLGRLESGSNLNILRQTGAGGLADPADAAYALIRSSGSDVATIAENTGIKASNIQKVKDHIFYNEHFLDRYESLGTPGMMKRFDSNQEMADAWKRLEAGTFILRDMQLLKHETAEAWYMKKYGPSYNNSHNAANRRYSSPLE